MDITLTDILTKISENFIKIISIILFLGITGYILYLASIDHKTLLSKPYLYSVGVGVSLLITFYLLIIENGKITSQNIYTIIIIIFFIIGLFVYLTTDISKSIIIVYLINICLFIIIFIGLMLISNLIINNTTRNNSWGGFIVNLIFYLPCLANDFIGHFLKDFYSTPQIFFTLFIIEIILILGFIYGMPLLQSYIKGDGITIQSDPVFLNQLTTLDSESVKTITTNTMTVDIDLCGNKIYLAGGNNNSTNVRSNFSISMWVYLNPPNTSRIPIGSESNIFYYGSNFVPNTLLDTNFNPDKRPTAVSLNNTATGTSFHPQITYAIDISKNGYYKIYVDSQQYIEQATGYPKPIVINTDILPYQKWNNIIFTYNKNMVDIFINGNLIRSKKLNINPMFSNYDIMGIGTDASSFYATSYENTNDAYLYGDTDDVNPIITPTEKPNILSLNTTNKNGLYGAVCNVMYYPNPLDRGKIISKYNYLVVKNIPIY